MESSSCCWACYPRCNASLCWAHMSQATSHSFWISAAVQHRLKSACQLGSGLLPGDVAMPLLTTCWPTGLSQYLVVWLWGHVLLIMAPLVPMTCVLYELLPEYGICALVIEPLIKPCQTSSPPYACFWSRVSKDMEFVFIVWAPWALCHHLHASVLHYSAMGEVFS